MRPAYDADQIRAAEKPLLAELPGVAWVAITEAYIDNYAGMYLTHSGRDARSLFSRLAPSVDEPAIAVNPKDPQQAVVAWQVPASAAYSHDGGETWKIAEGTAPGMYRISGDVSLAYDAAGHAILCYIAFDKLGSNNYWARGATRNGIFIRRSLDGGQTWEHDAHTVISHESTPGIPFEDKPWVVADTAGPHPGNLYIGWTHFTLAASDLMFSRSTDDGITWSSPITLSSVPGLPRDDNGALEGFHGVVGPDGALYTIWDARDGIMDAWAKLALNLTSSHEYQRLQGMLAKPALLGLALFRKATESVMSPFLAQMNMPSREEVLGIAQRLTHIEMTLDDLGAALEQLRRSAGPRPGPGT